MKCQKGNALFEILMFIVVVGGLALIIHNEQSSREACLEKGGTWIGGRTTHCLLIDNGKIIEVTP